MKVPTRNLIHRISASSLHGSVPATVFGPTINECRLPWCFAKTKCQSLTAGRQEAPARRVRPVVTEAINGESDGRFW